MKTKRTSSFTRSIERLAGLASLAVFPIAAQAAGILTPVGSADQPIQLESHHVRAVINNGFARTEVEQVFFNPNGYALEAIYAAPVPEAGALSELTIWAGERVLNGEVVAKSEADRIYEEEKASGNEVGKASQESYQRFEFAVSPVPAQGRVRLRYVYYEPLPIDTGVGRYTYQLEEGGTDEAAQSFWTLNDVVTADLQIEVLLKSAWPVARTRAPHFNGAVEETEDGALRYRYVGQGGQLDQDFVFYYMLEEGLPGRLEMMTYRESEDKPGSFMMVMTPGVDLQPLQGGSDYVFALDVSGSMQGKLHTLVAGVKKAVGEMRPGDRFRVVAFNDWAWELTRSWIPATPEGVAAALVQLDGLTANGGTNVYAGVELGLKRLDADRVSSLVLVTDGVTNRGIVDPVDFYKLLHGQDARFFGFLLGNGSNWPLMQLMAEASGGAYRAVSNSDDIIGEILLAKNKVAYESMHHAELQIDGVKTFDVSDFRIGKIHYGDQLVLFGRYENGGPATVRLKARLSGQDKVYQTDIQFPDTDRSHPELERMWALDQVRKIELSRDAGLLPKAEAAEAVASLGVAYQIVTEETAMIALDDDSFARRGMERRNQDRVAREQAARQSRPAASGAQRVDAGQAMYQNRSPSVGGGGAVEPWLFGLALIGAGAWQVAKRKRGGGAVLGVFLAVMLFAGGAAGLRAESADSLPRWTDRGHDAGGDRSSIDRSIATFWNVSEVEARVEPVKRSAQTESETRPGDQTEHREGRHALRQSRDTQRYSGSVGINLFNAIPLVDIVWGGKRRAESDAYSGTAGN